MYGSLGAHLDFSDRLLLWAYMRQKSCDPANSPYYFACLANLTNGWKSEELEIEVVTLHSQGEYTTDDVRNAYKNIGIPDVEDKTLIIGIFNSRLQDSPQQEA
jgi:ubiquitin carboxyl-terminal hydrolase 25/28